MGTLSGEVRTEVLCGRICDLEAENAKLREKVKRQADELTALRKAIEQRNGEWRPWKRQAERFVAENAKLRELVRDMYACVSHANEQDWFYFERDKFGCGMSCTVNGEVCGLSVLADRLRELGIEVDE